LTLRRKGRYIPGRIEKIPNGRPPDSSDRGVPLVKQRPSGRSFAERTARIIEDLYEGTLDEAAWSRAMLGLADLTHASSALLFAYNPQTGEVLRNENHRFDPVAVDEYRRYWSFQDSRLTPMLGVPVLEPMPEQGMDIGGWERSAFLNEFLRPIDAPHALPAWLFKTPQKAVTLSLQGTAKRGRFDRADIDRYRAILPHVRRALEIRDRLARAQVRAQSLAQGFQHANFGLLVLDRRRAILDANMLAERMLQTAPRSLRRNPDGTLWLAEPAAGALARWMSGGRPPEETPEGLIHVPRARSKPVSLLLVRLPEEANPWSFDGASWMLLMFDPTHRLAVGAEVIGHVFGLSPRESQVAALLASGESLKGLARLLSVSHNTVRSQLRAVFSKTGTRTQAELIERITLSPASFLPSGALPAISKRTHPIG
jgi:DNA-binding CsgD family transcriptional regulator/PAS domain-containing protein